MKTLLLGSIGVLAETSAMQWRAYNQALAAHDTGIYWNLATYCQLLRNPGGLKRLEAQGLPLDLARQVHQDKQRIFAEMLAAGDITLRPGIAALLKDCRAAGIDVGIITTTTQPTLDAIMKALSHSLSRNSFVLTTTREDVKAVKPAPDIYLHALKTLSRQPEDVLVIEDTPANAGAARQAGLGCVLLPGEFATVDTGPDVGKAALLDISLERCLAAHQAHLERSAKKALASVA